MLSGGDSPAVLLGRGLYREMVLPAERQFVATLKAATGKPVSLHICGNTARILADMATAGADVLELDHAVDLGAACRVVGPEIGLWGNLDPVGVLSRGTPTLVRRKAREVLDQVSHAGRRRFVLSSGCTLAMETPDANLVALLREVRLPRLPADPPLT